TLAIHHAPSHGKIEILAVHTGVLEIELACIQAHEDANSFPREILDLVNLVLQHEGLRKLPHAREVWILDKNRCVKRAPGMLVEVAPEIGRASCRERVKISGGVDR